MVGPFTLSGYWAVPQADHGMVSWQPRQIACRVHQFPASRTAPGNFAWPPVVFDWIASRGSAEWCGTRPPRAHIPASAGRAARSISWARWIGPRQPAGRPDGCRSDDRADPIRL